MKGLSALAAAVSLIFVLSCGGGEDVIIKTSDGASLTAADIDKNPLALLPGAAVGVVQLNAPELFASAAGAQLKRIVYAKLPVPPSAEFVPERDLKRLLVGLYSFQGADFAGVAVGDFKPEKIAAAADGTQLTPLGSPLVRVEYAGRVFYVSANIGFVVLTPHTAVFGNEVGIRRVLDRIEAGRIRVEVSPEIESLLERPGAPMAFGSETKDAYVASLTENVPAMRKLKLARVVGNFDPPGLNLAGTLTYSDEAAAGAGREQWLKMNDDLSRVTTITSLFGVTSPVRQLEITTTGPNAQFKLGLDSAAATTLLQQVGGLLGVPL